MTIDKKINYEEGVEKARFIAQLRARYEKAKREGKFKGDIKEFLLKEKQENILNRSQFSKGGNGKYIMPEINMDSFDWDIWLRERLGPKYETLEEEEENLSRRKVPNKLLAYKYGATSQREEDLIGGHVDDWTNEISKGELDPSVNFMQYLDMILGRNKKDRGGIVSIVPTL